MKKNLKHILYSYLILLVLCIIFSVPSYCDNEENEELGEKITLSSIIKNTTNPVSNVFTYQIEPASTNKESSFNTPKTFNVNFDGIVPDSDNKVTAYYDIDFSDVEFKQAGQYEYIVSEINSLNPTAYPISDLKYKIYVHVSNEGSELKKRVETQVLDLKKQEKSNLSYTHEAKYTYIHIFHSIKGNAVDPNEYLLYKLVIEGNEGDIYQIIGQDDEVVFEGKKIKTSKTYTVKSGNDNYAYIYLKGNQEATIGYLRDGVYQIPTGIKYQISSLKSRKWSTIIDNAETKESAYKQTLDGDQSNTIKIVQEKNFDVALTGIFINLMPFIVLIVIGAIGIIFSIKVKKEEKKESKKL